MQIATPCESHERLQKEPMRLPDDQYDIEVELTLYPTDQGGRRAPLFPGYRAGHLALDNTLWIAAWTPKDPDRELVFPGETATMLVHFFYHPEDLSGRLWVGREFLLEEGTYIGSGVITAMLNFERHAKQHTDWSRQRSLAPEVE